MRVELFYFVFCPRWKVAEERLTEALRNVGRDDTTVQRRLVETPDEAEAVGFTGSPTIRIDGTDPFATGSEQMGLSCCLYTTATGLSGAVVKRAVSALVGTYVLVAVANRVAETSVR